MAKIEQLENAMLRKHEANVEFKDVNTQQIKKGFDWDKMSEICEQEGVTLEDFLEYTRTLADGIAEALGK